MSDTGKSNFFAIVLGVFAAVSFVGCAGMFMVSWVLNKSVEALFEQMLSDTGMVFLEEADYEEVEDIEYVEEE